jgi:hypothetical protein
MKVQIDKGWCAAMAALECDAEIGAGLLALDPCGADVLVIGVDLAKPGSEFTVYTIAGTAYPVRHPYYLGSCDKCGWIGSTELCGGDEDVVCPECYSVGADCGKIADAASDAASDAERRAELES